VNIGRRKAVRSSRRAFLVAASATVAVSKARVAFPQSARAGAARTSLKKPPRLAAGDTVALIQPASGGVSPDVIEGARRHIAALGLRVRVPKGLGVSKGDAHRADEINDCFSDPAVKALLPIRGGWGSTRVLGHLDYSLISAHPKIVMGFSDAGALLMALCARSGLVTFHGPMGISSWTPFEVRHVRRLLFEAGMPNLQPPSRPQTITPGRARGRLLGGNLTVLASMVGTPYLRPWEDVILFLEEVREPTSEIDRMLTQLDQAGVLKKVRGVVFGQCSRCARPALDDTLTVDTVLRKRLGALQVPAWHRAPIGHAEAQFTLPLGIEAEIDADKGTIRLMEAAVS
jgi:muramoyltetrapeptide carboxypeptidase